MSTAAASPTTYQPALDRIIAEVIAPSAHEIDRSAVFPRAALHALGETSLLGLISAHDVGGSRTPLP